MNEYYPEICDSCVNTYASKKVKLTSSLDGKKFDFNMCDRCYMLKEEETEFLPIWVVEKNSSAMSVKDHTTNI